MSARTPLPLTVLIVGFGPFPGQRQNPTGPLAMRLARMRRPARSEARRIACVLPTTFAAVDDRLARDLERYRPDVVLLFGLAARTPHFRIETRARNALADLFPDAAGKRPPRRLIDPQSGTEIRARAPGLPLLQAAAKARVPVRLSHDAGGYICNLAYWRALSFVPTGAPSPLVQFVHIPRVASGPRPRRNSGRRRVRSAHKRPIRPADLLRAAEALLGVLVARARTRRI